MKRVGRKRERERKRRRKRKKRNERRKRTRQTGGERVGCFAIRAWSYLSDNWHQKQIARRRVLGRGWAKIGWLNAMEKPRCVALRFVLSLFFFCFLFFVRDEKKQLKGRWFQIKKKKLQCSHPRRGAILCMANIFFVFVYCFYLSLGLPLSWTRRNH